jgi:hypothetical protein
MIPLKKAEEPKPRPPSSSSSASSNSTKDTIPLSFFTKSLDDMREQFVRHHEILIQKQQETRKKLVNLTALRTVVRILKNNYNAKCFCFLLVPIVNI